MNLLKGFGWFPIYVEISKLMNKEIEKDARDQKQLRENISEGVFELRF